MSENATDVTKKMQKEKDLIAALCKQSVRWLRENISSLKIQESLNVGLLINDDEREKHIGKLVGAMTSEEVEKLLSKVNDDSPAKPKKIFIAHGNSPAAENAVTAIQLFCREQGLECIILRDVLAKSRTIIEKLIDLAEETNYAVILYTGCDKGRMATERDDELKSRARQNVIFEHGFFTAKLGREHVCALIEPGMDRDVIEQPSNNSGVIYIEMDGNRQWKYKLAAELKGADILPSPNYPELH